MPSPLSPRRAQVQVTHEQQQILNHDIHRDHVVKIMAFAGTARPLLPTSCHSCFFTENKLDTELVLLLAFSELFLEGTLALSVQLSLIHQFRMRVLFLYPDNCRVVQVDTHTNSPPHFTKKPTL